MKSLHSCANKRIDVAPHGCSLRVAPCPQRKVPCASLGAESHFSLGLRKGQNYITLMHDLQSKRLLFACEGRNHQIVLNSASDRKAYEGGQA